MSFSTQIIAQIVAQIMLKFWPRDVSVAPAALKLQLITSLIQIIAQIIAQIMLKFRPRDVSVAPAALKLQLMTPLIIAQIPVKKVISC